MYVTFTHGTQILGIELDLVTYITTAKAQDMKAPVNLYMKINISTLKGILILKQPNLLIKNNFSF